jgi:replicative DNA helicase
MNLPEIKLPPHSIEAEQSLIGGLLIYNNAWDRIADVVRDTDFYRDDHRRIFRHIGKLIQMGRPADVVTVYESIEQSNEVDQTGGLAYLGDIANATPSAANIERYAEIVRERATLRQLQAAATALYADCAGPAGCSPCTIAFAAEVAILTALDRTVGDPRNLQDVFGEVIAYADDRCTRGADLAGIATGFPELDKATGGLEPGQLVIIAARPSVGKTAFACNVVDNVVQRGASVLFHTLEMGARDIGLRLLALRSGVPVHQMRAGTAEDAQWRAIAEAQGRAEGQRLFIDDKPAISCGYVRSKARRIKRQHGLDLIVIDYLQLMRGAGDNRTQEIGSISRDLKALAKDLAVPIIALAQLNRNVETRTDKRPLSSDLRDSGEVEQDGDIVAMLHREEIYNPAPEWRGIAELIVRKNRNGPLAEIALAYLHELMTFKPLQGRSPRNSYRAPQPARRGFD